MIRRLALGSLASCVLSLVACSAPSSGDAATGDEANLTERKIVEHEAFVTGKYLSSKTDAEASLKAACDAYAAAQRAIAGERLLDSSCGEPQNLASSALVTGAYLSSLGDAHDAWSKACDAELARAKTIFGDRLLGGGCSAPKNIASSGFLMASSFEAFVVPPKGKSVKLTGALRGAYLSSLGDGVKGWRAACEAWSTRAAAAYGPHLVVADCGEPANTVTSSYLDGSRTTLEVATGSDAEAVASAGPLVRGGNLSSLGDATQSWQRACDDTLAFAKELLGDRLLAGTCSAPANTTTSSFLLGGTAPIAVTSAGAKKIVVEGFAVGAYLSSLGDATASLVKASNDTLRASVARIGAARVEGFEVDEPTSLASSSYVFGAKTSILVGYDVPEGGLEAIASTTHVKGPASPSLGDAASGWAKACADAAENAKAEHGARFVAASCGARRRTGRRSSPISRRGSSHD